MPKSQLDIRIIAEIHFRRGEGTKRSNLCLKLGLIFKCHDIKSLVISK